MLDLKLYRINYFFVTKCLTSDDIYKNKGIFSNLLDAKTMNHFNSIFLILLLSVTITLLSCSGSEKKDQVQKGEDKAGLGTFPDVTFTTMKGEKLSISDLKGKVVFVNFWATWCAPCRREIPDFIRFQKKYGGDNFTILGVSLDEQGFEVVEPYAKEMGINYPLVVDNQNLGDKLGGIYAVPTTYFLDKQGNIAGRKIGYFPEDQMKKQIDEMVN